MERKGLSGKNITVKLKLTTFEVKTRSVTAPTYVSSAEEVRHREGDRDRDERKREGERATTEIETDKRNLLTLTSS